MLLASATHTRIWGERICLSVCLSVMNFDLNYLRTGEEIKWAEFFLGYLCQKVISQKNLFSGQGTGMAWAEGQKANLLSKYITGCKIMV